jgi:transcription elongation factor Elf1
MTIWEHDPLWTKAKLFLGRAFEYSADDPLFGLWCSFGLELLARAAIAAVSPTLLAEPHRDHQNLLHALGVGPKLSAPTSIGAAQVVALCQGLFSGFTKEDAVASMALINRRNAELHSAEAAFASYPSRQWLPGFYHSCSSLVETFGQDLESLLGADQARIAKEVLQESKEGVLGRVKASIAAYKRVFDEKAPEDRYAAAETARTQVAKLVYERHHKVTCPACTSDASVEGDLFGPKRLEHEDDDIVVRQSVTPRVFNCLACGLKLTGYAELDVAELGGIYTRRTTFTPEEYYGLIDPDTADMSEYVEQYLESMQEYDNE